jgi:hypothetical protein
MLGARKMDDRWPANGIAWGHIDSIGKVFYDISVVILGCCVLAKKYALLEPKTEMWIKIKQQQTLTNNGFERFISLEK